MISLNRMADLLGIKLLKFENNSPIKKHQVKQEKNIQHK